MGILIADYIDIDDVDFYSTGAYIDMVDGLLREEDGTITLENHMKMQELREKLERYNKTRDKLYAHAYGKIKTLMYQTDSRNLYTEEECLDKMREVKKQVTEMRKTLEEKYIKLGHVKDIKDFNEYDRDKWLKPEVETEDVTEDATKDIGEE